MMTSSNGNIFRATGHLRREFPGSGEFPAQRPVTRNFNVFFDLRLNKRLSKQSWGWWFETLSCPLWRHCNAGIQFGAFQAPKRNPLDNWFNGETPMLGVLNDVDYTLVDK